MIELVTGTPGSGKSYYSVRRIAQALDDGKMVGTNIKLHEGWEHELARSNWIRRVWPGRVAVVEAGYDRRLYVSASLDELLRLRLRPCGRCDGCERGRTCRKEGRGLMVLDEAHTWLNARTWDASEDADQTRATAVANRLALIGFFSQHRHFGWNVVLITQDAENLDAQVRRNFEHHVHLRNLRRYKPMGLPFRPFPFNLFSAITTWCDRKQTPLSASMYLLNKRVAKLYDTMASAAPERDRSDVILLPVAAARGTDEAGKAGAAPPPGPPARRPPRLAPAPAPWEPAGDAERDRPDLQEDLDGAGRHDAA